MRDEEQSDYIVRHEARFDRICDIIIGIGTAMLFILGIAVLVFGFSGCTSYKGGVVTDGTNLAVGMKLPGTEWTLNILDYVGGIRVAVNEGCVLTMTNDISETNSYFGVIETHRTSRTTATIEPTESTKQ